MTGHILLAYRLNGKGGGEPLTTDTISGYEEGRNPVWIHCNADHPDIRSWMEKEISFPDEFIITALLADETRPRLAKADNGILLILRGMNISTDYLSADMASVRLWITRNLIISMQKQKLEEIHEIERKIKSGTGPENSADFICILVDILFRRMRPVLEELDERTGNLEEQVLEAADTAMEKPVIDVRKQAVILRRHMAPQRDAISQLCSTGPEWIANTHRHSLQELLNQATHYVEDLDTVRERAQVVKDELASTLAERLNRNMYVLSVIAAVFLPLGFLTGLMGINAGGVPGTGNSSAFWIFTGMLSVIVIIQIIVFRKSGWF